MVTRNLLRSAIISSLLLLFCASGVRPTHAASGSISVQPISGSYSNGETFEASIRVDGGGEALNASKASISVSEGLSVVGVTLGDCGFAFVTTPSLSSLSYAGVILGGSVNSCTVYTLKLKVVSGTNGYIFISDGSIKAFSDSIELISKVINSSYSFTGSSSNNSVASQPSPTQPPLVSDKNGMKYYTLIYGVTSNEEAKSKMKVILDAALPSQIIVIPSLDKNDPNVLTAVFDNVEEGVHTVGVYDDEKPVSQEVVNIEGQNREVSLGVAPQPSASLIWYVLAGVITIIILSIIVIGIVFLISKRRQGQLQFNP